MARPKKDGRRATGIQGKSGYLYILFSNPVVKDGVRSREKRWISTGLTDTPDNIKKATEMRSKLLNKRDVPSSDRNVTFSEYTDYVLICQV